MGASKKEEIQNVALFLTVAGSESLEVFNSFYLTQAEEANYEIAVQKFKEYCSLGNKTHKGK